MGFITKAARITKKIIYKSKKKKERKGHSHNQELKVSRDITVCRPVPCVDGQIKHHAGGQYILIQSIALTQGTVIPEAVSATQRDRSIHGTYSTAVIIYTLHGTLLDSPHDYGSELPLWSKHYVTHRQSFIMSPLSERATGPVLANARMSFNQ